MSDAGRVPHLYTIVTAAKALGRHPETVRRAVQAGALACYRLGGSIRISPEHLLAYLESHECPARDPTDLASNGIAAAGTSAGAKVEAGAGLQQARRLSRALDKPSRISNPRLSVIRSS